MKELKGKAVFPGNASGEIILSKTPISFLGDVDPKTGKIVNPELEIYGERISGKIFCFPRGRGSTVGSYVIYELKRRGLAPAGIVNTVTEPIIAVGAIISRIPCLSGIDLKEIEGYSKGEILGNRLRLY